MRPLNVSRLRLRQQFRKKNRSVRRVTSRGNDRGLRFDSDHSNLRGTAVPTKWHSVFDRLSTLCARMFHGTSRYRSRKNRSKEGSRHCADCFERTSRLASRVANLPPARSTVQCWGSNGPPRGLKSYLYSHHGSAHRPARNLSPCPCLAEKSQPGAGCLWCRLSVRS